MKFHHRDTEDTEGGIFGLKFEVLFGCLVEKELLVVSKNTAGGPWQVGWIQGASVSFLICPEGENGKNARCSRAKILTNWLPIRCSVRPMRLPNCSPATRTKT